MRVIFYNPVTQGITCAECCALTVNTHYNTLEIHLMPSDDMFCIKLVKGTSQLYMDTGTCRTVDTLVKDAYITGLADLRKYTVVTPDEVGDEDEYKGILTPDDCSDFEAGLESLVSKRIAASDINYCFEDEDSDVDEEDNTL